MSEHYTVTWICDKQGCNRSVIREIDGQLKDETWKKIEGDGRRKPLFFCPEHAQEYEEAMSKYGVE